MESLADYWQALALLLQKKRIGKKHEEKVHELCELLQKIATKKYQL